MVIRLAKDSTRSMLNKEKIEENKVGIRKILERFLPDAIFMSNSEWIMNLNYVDFIRDYGSKFSVNQMVNLESVKLRLERKQNMSFLEFNYSILQAYDFVELNKRTNGCCRLQIGGSDQWGNIISGIGLGKKFGIDLYGITTPLITNSNGSKMGKTEKGAVWLSEDLLDPYDYWQFFRNIDDRDVVKYMNLFTEIEHVEEYENLKGNDINIAKKRLAFEATKICHGEENANTSMKKAESIFENGDVDELPVIFHNEISIINALKELNFVSSGADAKRLIIGGGCMINDVITRDKGHMIISPAKISVGKKKIGLIKGKM